MCVMAERAGRGKLGHALEPHGSVLTAALVRRADERGDDEPAGTIRDERSVPFPDAVVENPLDMA